MLHYIFAALPLTIFAQNLNPIPCVVTSVSSTSVCDFNLTLSSSMSAVITDTSCIDPNSVSTTPATLGISFNSNWSYPVTYMCRGVTKWLNRTAAMKLNTVDGYSRPIVTFNGQYPGPIIKLTNSSSTSQARINVMNMNSLESTSVSFNGITFENAPFMSGAPSISQCPISPSQKFSYRFPMNPLGTRSYESLQGGQGSDGASGIAVVGNGTITAGIVVEVADWYPYEFSTLVKAAPYDWNGLKKTVSGSQTGGFYPSFTHYKETNSYTDFTGIGMIPWWSILVGGKGFTNSNAYGPVRMYQTTQTSGTNVKFHFVHTGIEKPINIDIPGHNLTVIGKDGYSLSPVEVDTLWILPGESWDVYVKLNVTGGNFPIRARGPNTNSPATVNRANSPWSFGVFNYGGISPDYPSTTLLNTPSGSRNLNCPFSTYRNAQSPRRNCIFQGTLKSSTNINQTTLQTKLSKSDVTYLLTMGAQRGKYNINGYRMPSFIQAPIQLNGALTNNTRCPNTFCTTFDKDNETHPTCECRHQLDIQQGKVVTLILTNFGPAIDTNLLSVFGSSVQKPRATGYTQTFTIQGHSFYLLHQEQYPQFCGIGGQERALNLLTYNLQYCPTTSGFSYSFPDEIDCTRVGTIAVGDCLNPLIRNLTRIEEKFNLHDPPKMNTISIPLGHFVAIRFIANNPGVWLARSTNKLAYAKGQAMVFNVSLPQSNQRVSIPQNMPQCNPFVNNTLNYAIERIVAPTVAPVFVQEPCPQLVQFNARWLIFGILNGILVGFCFWWTCYMWYWAPEYSMAKKKPKKGRTAGNNVRATDDETAGFTTQGRVI